MKTNTISTRLLAALIILLNALQLVAAPIKTGNLKSFNDQYFMLPEGIKTGSLHGPDQGCFNDAKAAKNIKGAGGNISICMTFQNSTSEDILIDLPAGLTFLSGNGTEEKGILLQKVTVSVPANGTERILLNAFSFNLEREYTRGPQDLYQFGSVLNHPALAELLEVASTIQMDENKKLTKEEDDKMRFISATFQDALYNILMNGQLNEVDKQQLLALNK
jgi:hypothetical protein